jgi:N-methylhydantoinase A
MRVLLVGVDTGGTFTDLAFMSEEGRVFIAKVPSTPSDPSQAILAGLKRAAPRPGFAVVHGTTVATNALLERRGAKTALLTTQGCRDVLEIARQTRAELYSLAPLSSDPLIPRELRYEALERLDRNGEVVIPLDMESLERALDAAHMQGVESVAVCFLHSYLSPDHEREAGRRARARGFHVSLSSDIAPEYREYERTSTVCADAYVAPVMAGYIGRLQERLREVGASRLAVMQSNGGTLRAEEAAANAIKTVLSGPAGGLIAAMKTAKAAGFARVMTFDMGGTSTDVSLMDGEPVTIRTGEVAGLPLLTPMLDIHTVGAGGGSIARVDSGGGLRVGPQSAGADPGPVACGHGHQLTVTDANLLLGRIPAALRLAGGLPLDVERVRRFFMKFAAALNLTSERAAEGILAVVNAQMARALRHISVERGRDPADYTLVSFGGAGGLHACALAEAVGMRCILVPRFPGAFSALGLALADVRREYARSFFARTDRESDPEVKKALEELAERAREDMSREGVAPGDVLLAPFVEARYTGQSYALRVPFQYRLSTAARAFHRAHRDRYGHSDKTQPVEVVTAGLTASGASGSMLPRNAGMLFMESPPAAPEPKQQETRIWLDDAWRECLLYSRASLIPGQRLNGPAVVIQEDATTWIEPGWHGVVNPQSDIMLTRDS